MAILAACDRNERGAENTDLLLLTLDTVRGDRWGILGDPEARTPTWDRLARGGTLAFEGRATAPITLPSHASMLTGLPPVVHGVRDNGTFRLAAAAGPTVAEVLQAEGWDTAAFISAFPLAARFGLSRGFRHYDEALGGPQDQPAGHLRERTAAATIARVQRWFAGPKAPAAQTPLFLWVHFFDPHAEYAPPPPWDQLPADAYRAEIAYTDRQTLRLLRRLQEHRAGRRWRFLIVTDHGEALGAGGESTHGVLLGLPTMRAPLVTRTPEYRPRLLATPVSLERVASTLLELATVGEMPPLAAPALSAPAEPILGETLYPHFNYGWRGLRVLEESPWRLVSGAVDRLYRLDEDPAARHDVAGAHPQEALRLRAALDAQWRTLMQRATPAATADLAQEDVEMLRSLGYASAGGNDAVELEQAFLEGADPRARIGEVDALNAAITLLGEGHAEEAIERLRAIVARDPDSRLAWEFLGRALLAGGAPGEASDALQRALELGRNPQTVALDWAAAERQLGNAEGEWHALLEALRLEPQSALVRERMGIHLLERGDASAAMRFLKEAVEIRPRLVRTRGLLAQTYEGMGLREDAASHWRRVLELEPESRWGARARAALARKESRREEETQ